MTVEPPETSELQAFVAAVDAGSISGAAAELGLPRATVSRRLARLEERLDTRLLHRTTRSQTTTEAGVEYYRHARAILDAVDLATRAVAQPDAEPRGLLRISLPPLRPGTLEGLLLAFLDEHPQVELEVIASTAHEDLRERNIDVAWRAGVDFDPSLVARKLARTDLVAVAAPAYLERAGRPATVDELLEHRCIVGFVHGERPATHWPQRGGGAVRIRARLATNDLGLQIAAVVGGRGIGLLPRMLVAPHLERGGLEAVLPDDVGADSQVALVYPDRHHLKPPVRAFVDHAVRWFREQGPELPEDLLP
jgi:DNA-binding transcriptional LysR family regulator